MTNGEKKLYEYKADKTGSFMASLFHTIFLADHINLEKLSKSYPEEVAAVMLYKDQEGYWPLIQKEYRRIYG